MKQLLSVLILIAVLVSMGIGGTFADWMEEDRGEYCFQVGEWTVDQEGSKGWWGNLKPIQQEVFTEAEINIWLNFISTVSCWFTPGVLDVVAPAGIDVVDMVEIIERAEGGTPYQKFLGHYLVQRLNQISGLQSPASLHNVMDVPSYAGYIINNFLGLSNPVAAPGWEIIGKIENKCPSVPDVEYDIMHKICEALNDLVI